MTLLNPCKIFSQELKVLSLYVPFSQNYWNRYSGAALLMLQESSVVILDRIYCWSGEVVRVPTVREPVFVSSLPLLSMFLCQLETQPQPTFMQHLGCLHMKRFFTACGFSPRSKIPHLTRSYIYNGTLHAERVFTAYGFSPRSKIPHLTRLHTIIMEPFTRSVISLHTVFHCTRPLRSVLTLYCLACHIWHFQPKFWF